MADPTPTNGASHDDVDARMMELQLKTLENDIFLARAQFMRQAGMTFNDRRDEYEVLGYHRIITNRQFRDEYARGGLAGRIVDVMPDACWRGEPPMRLIDDEDPEKDTTFEQAWTKLDTQHQICAKFLRVDKLSRLSTFAVLLLGAPGKLEDELPKADKRGLRYIMPFSGAGGPNAGNDNRSTLAYDFGDCAVHEYDTDSQSERFGLPKSYTLKRADLSSPTFSRPVHWSRIIHVAEGLLDDEVYGQPALERVWNLLIDLRKVTGGGSEAFWLRANQGTHINIDKDMALDPGEFATVMEKLREQSELYKHQMTRWLQTRGVDVKTLGSDVANFGPNADAIITQIAGAKGIPKRILTGSEMGELASSQDRENFKDIINGRQMQHCAPNMIRPLGERLIAYGYLPTPKNGEFQVDWSHIQVMTETEKAAGAAQWMNTNASAKNAGLQPVFTEAETRDKWYGMAPMTDEQLQAIEDQKRANMELAQEMAPKPAPGEPEPDEKKPGFPRAARAHRSLGGPGSGNFGHEGRPGEVGGSGGGGGNDDAMDLRPIGFRKPAGIGRTDEPRSHEYAYRMRQERIRRFREKSRLQKERRRAARALGGPGSGNFGHAGRPGEVGGSSSEGGSSVSREMHNRPSSSYEKHDPNGHDTQAQYKREDGTYMPDRAKLHDEAYARQLDGKTPVDKPVFVMLGGGPASGKSSLVNSQNIGGKNSVLVNADEMKEELPEYRENPTMPTVSSYVHEESSDMSKALLDKASAGHYNTVLDGTGDSSIESLEKKVATARKSGAEVQGRYVTIPTDEAVSRSQERADRLRAAGRTARQVPEVVIRETHRNVSAVVPEALKRGLFDTFELWDNTSGLVKVVSAKGKSVTVHNDKLWKEFLAKGK